MAVDEDARMRAVLAEMQLRISQGPNAALGLGDAYSPEDVRAAFLALTKQFHPARFGRSAIDVQKLSNEVFLGIKSAHELLMRTLGASTRPGGSDRPTIGMKPLSAEGTARTAVAKPTSTGSIPRIDAGNTTQPLARGTDRESGPASPPRQTGSFARVEPTPVPQTGPHARPVISRTNTPLGHPGAVTRPAQTGSIPVARQTGSIPRIDPAALNPPTQRGVPSADPAALNPPTQRGLSSGQRPSQPSAPPSSTNFNAATQRGLATGPGMPVPQPTQPVPRPTPTPAASAASAEEQAVYREALRYIAQGNWGAARTSLIALGQKAPTSKQYQSLVHYARGREAHVSGNLEGALAEYQRALQVDPDLGVVKQAVAELQRRR